NSATPRARVATAQITVLPGDAHDLPFPDGSFDAAVAELMLCSVTRPDVALAEVRRVVRPGGALRLLEHVRHPSRWIGRLQDAVDPVWTALEGRGCHIGRDTPRVVEEAGFTVEAIDTVPLPPGVDWLFPIVAVRARRP
ncbi:MAG: methyltransferase domain-containing protein, partial [Deinococcales bacterium]